MNLDVIGTGSSVEEAISELLEVIEVQIDACKKYGAQLLHFAPPEIWRIYRAAYKAKKFIPDEMMVRIVRNANKRLGAPVDELFLQAVETRDYDRQCQMV